MCAVVNNHHLYFPHQTIHQRSLLGDNYDKCQHLTTCFSTVSLYQRDKQRGVEKESWSRGDGAGKVGAVGI